MPFPDSEYLQSLYANKDLIVGGTVRDFPLLRDPEVQQALGSRGKKFGASLQSRVFWDESRQRSLGVVYFPNDVEGPVGRAHGGSIATILDALFGYQAIRTKGWGSFTVQLNVTYRNFVPLNSCCRYEAWTTKVEGKKIFMDIELKSLDGLTTHATATSIFVQPKHFLTYEKVSLGVFFLFFDFSKFVFSVSFFSFLRSFSSHVRIYYYYCLYFNNKIKT